MDGNAVNIVSEALINVGAIFSQAVSMVTTNAIPLAFIGMALVGRGLGLFRKTIHTH